MHNFNQVKAVVTISMFFLSIVCNSQISEAQDVIIRGDADCSDGHQSASCGFSDNSGWTNPSGDGNGGYGDNGGRETGGGTDTQVAVVKAIDVRCDKTAGNDSTATTTSLADDMGRGLAAQKLFRQANADAGGGTRVPNGTKFKVTYADGGTETWIWRGFMQASQVPGVVMIPTGDLSKGDGTVKPKSCAIG